MSQELADDGVFWLPSEFLTDDHDDHLLTPFNSDLTSPLTEEDHHHFIAMLTHKIPNSTLHDYPTKKVSTSPQSTLYGSIYSTNKNHSPGFYPTQNYDPFSYQQHQVQCLYPNENIGRRNVPQMGMRPFFLGEIGVRKERTGTGVFLPTRIQTNPTENVHTGSSVLLQHKVVHALNLNLDLIESRDNRNNHYAEYGVGLKNRNDVKMNNLRPVVKQELGLPQEWTY